MCFSAEADLVATVVVGAVGVDALRHVTRRVELPLASLPLVFAVHSLIETFVWWGLEGKVSESVGDAAAWLYLLIAFGVLPILVPVAVAALEPEVNRRRLAVFTAAGVVVAAALLHGVLRGPVEVAIEGHHLDYRVDLWHGGLLVALYVLVTCGSMLASSHPHVRRFGMVNLVAVLAIIWIDKTALVSVWCFWAAVTSVAIAIHLRMMHGSRPAAELVTA